MRQSWHIVQKLWRLLIWHWGSGHTSNLAVLWNPHIHAGMSVAGELENICNPLPSIPKYFYPAKYPWICFLLNLFLLNLEFVQVGFCFCNFWHSKSHWLIISITLLEAHTLCTIYSTCSKPAGGKGPRGNNINIGLYLLCVLMERWTSFAHSWWSS